MWLFQFFTDLLGEDDTVQGLPELAGGPYVGSGAHEEDAWGVRIRQVTY